LLLHRTPQRQQPLEPPAILAVDLALLRGLPTQRDGRFGIRAKFTAIELFARTLPCSFRFYGLVTGRAAHEIASGDGISTRERQQSSLSRVPSQSGGTKALVKVIGAQTPNYDGREISATD
jgi:hypothetical protein